MIAGGILLLPIDVYARYNADPEGQLAWLECSMDTVESLRRGSGRTRRALRNLRKGDLYVVHDEKYAKDIRHQLRDMRKKTVKVVVMSPQTLKFPVDLYDYRGNVVFDHFWTYEHIKWRLKELLDFPTQIIQMCQVNKGKSASASSSLGPIWPDTKYIGDKRRKN